jgi:regulator of protease activity HflC (stomatin/prohibitin superfamily)
MFGKPVDSAKTVPGSYFKLPLIQDTHYFKKHIHLYEMVSVVKTTDNKFPKLNTRVQWRISDAVQYLKRLNSDKQADEFISDTVTNAQLSVISDKSLEDLIGAKANMPPVTDTEITFSTTYEIEKSVEKKLPSVGLELMNIKILVTYPTDDDKVPTK